MNPQELSLLAHFQYPTHWSYVYQYGNKGRIHCIKYGNRGIIWETFENHEFDQCQEYMIADLPAEFWGFEADE